jgi:hypothetical protein
MPTIRLVPVTLRQGERSLGGALSWAEPQPLAEFPNFGPFAGMRRRPMSPSSARCWPSRRLTLPKHLGSLADGTPLVTG